MNTLKEKDKKLYQCGECKLKYEKEEIARQCEAWCKEHKSCNLDIIKHAVNEVEPERSK